jgi:predicted transposase/invertase (TIGR01784 family)
MSKLISFDFAIKSLHMLKERSSYDIIEGFISALLVHQGYKPVKILALLNTEVNKYDEFSPKRSLAALIVEDTDHNKYIIEIERQLNKWLIHEPSFNTSFNASRFIVDQLDTSQNYAGIKKALYICLLYFTIDSGTIYDGKTISHQTEIKEKLTFHIKDKQKATVYDAIDIVPEYIFISVPQFDDHVEKEIDDWLYVMKNREVKQSFRSPTMQKVAERLNMLNMTQAMRNEYFYYIKQVADYEGPLEAAEERGEARGEAKGEARGFKKGKAEGIKTRNIEIAKSLLSRGMNEQEISQITGLTSEQIKALSKKK